jgi:hypothetical protein
MRNKTISLCPTSFEMAQKMPNFSDWVRKQILKHKQTLESKPVWRYMCETCYFTHYLPYEDNFAYCSNRDTNCKARIEGELV